MSAQVKEIEYDSRTESSGDEQEEVHVRTVRRLFLDTLRKLPFSTTTTSSSEIVLMVFSPSNVDASQAWFWTPEWQAEEAIVSKELAAGLGEVFDDVEDFLADLDR